jgi:hypothetical protein
MDVSNDDDRRNHGLVMCDHNCLAVDEPTTCAEYEIAYEHWRYHSRLYGCSHGC